MVVLFGIASSVIFLGQDLISAEQEAQHTLHDVARKQRGNALTAQQLLDRIRHFNGDKSDDDPGSDEIETTKNEETERMEVNGEEVNIKKSELDEVWKEVESQLDRQNENNQRTEGDGDGGEEQRETADSDSDTGDPVDSQDVHDDDGDIDSHHDDKHDVDAVLKDAAHPTADGHDEDDESPDIPINADDHGHDHIDDDDHRSDAAKEATSSDGAHRDKDDGVSLDSEDLSRLFYPEYYALPTFFDIEPDDVEALVSYWKAPGVLDYRSMATKYRFLQKDDLKQHIFAQDEHHNPRLSTLFDVNQARSHSVNTDWEYQYPFLIPLESYPPQLLTPQNFKYNLSRFLNEEIGRMHSKYTPKWDINEILAAHNVRHKTVISKEEMYAKHEQYLRDHHRDVELIFPENDTLFHAMMTRFGERLKAMVEKEESDPNEANIGGRFLRALKRVEDEKDRRRRRLRDNRHRGHRDARRLREGFGLFDSADGDGDDGGGHHHRERVDLATVKKEELTDSVRSKAEPPRIHNLNGMTADITYFHRNRSTPQYLHNPALDDPRAMAMAGNMNFGGAMERRDRVLVKNDRFWRLHDHCIRRKSSTVYPNWRILYKTAPLTCEVILERLIEPIARCLEQHGLDCPAMIDHGYFRFVFKSEAAAKWLYADPADPEEMVPIVLKVMKTQFVEWSTDWMRHIREALFLQQLSRWETDFMAQFGPQFVSEGRDRAFYFVPELGRLGFACNFTVDCAH